MGDDIDCFSTLLEFHQLAIPSVFIYHGVVDSELTFALFIYRTWVGQNKIRMVNGRNAMNVNAQEKGSNLI